MLQYILNWRISETLENPSSLFAVTKPGIFKFFDEISGHFPAVLVTTKTRYFKPKHDFS